MHPEQVLLFDLGTIDFQSIRETRERIMAAKNAVCTIRTYASAWKAFQLWCEQAGRDSLPATPSTVIDFFSWCINQSFRLETVHIRRSAIRSYHLKAKLPSPIDDSVREFLHCAKRDRKEVSCAKDALTYEQLKAIMKTLRGRDPLKVRNRAMILLTFAGGWRRSEMVGLQYGDLEFSDKGMTIHIRSSKTDQTGKGRIVGIQPGRRALTCPVRAVQQWLAVRGSFAGPLFVGLTSRHRVTEQSLHERGESLNTTLKAVLNEIGAETARYGAHSLRAGMITAASETGASECSIMQRTGHRSSATLQRYIRPAHVFTMNPMKNVL